MSAARNGWTQHKLGDLIDIKHGFAFKGEYFADSGSHIVLTPGNFYDAGGFKERPDKAKWYTGPVPKEFILKEGDLIVAMTEQGEGLLGSSALIPQSNRYLHNQRLGLVRIRDEKEVDQKYLYYLFNSRPVRQQIRATANGAKVRHTSPSRIYEVRVLTPPLPVQHLIAAILSGYEELIENNQQRIRILEAMSCALYREWFVNFRFPGHEKIPFAGFRLKRIPKGWEVKTVEALTSFLNRGLSPSYDDNGNSVVINQKCIRDQRLSLEPARRQQKPVPDEKLIRFGDVLINSTGVGTLGRVAQVYEELRQCTVDSHVTIVRPNSSVDVDYFGLALLNEEDTFERSGVGATGQTELSRTAIGCVELGLPPSPLQNQFGKIVRPIRLASITLAKQIDNLRRTCDLLLPRLLGGELAVATNKHNRHSRRHA
jgi:type I restriction enzyme S subunit